VPRLRNRLTGVTVSVGDAVAGRLGAAWEAVGDDQPQQDAADQPGPAAPVSPEGGPAEPVRPAPEPTEPAAPDDQPAAPEPAGPPAGPGTDYDKWTTVELKDEVRRRNATFSEGERLPIDRNKAELIQILQQDDEKQ
jgi:hypothetical protein